MMILNDNISLMGLDLFSINDFLVDEFLEFLQDEPFKTWKSNTLKAHKLNAYAKHPRKCRKLLKPCSKIAKIRSNATATQQYSTSLTPFH
jgi:hypothetical protein